MRSAPDLSVRAAADAVIREAQRAVRASAGLDEQWGGLVPPALAGTTRPGRVVRGTLTIHAANASARYLCERWLAGGGLESIRAAAKSVKNAKVVM